MKKRTEKRWVAYSSDHPGGIVYENKEYAKDDVSAAALLECQMRTKMLINKLLIDQIEEVESEVEAHKLKPGTRIGSPFLTLEELHYNQALEDVIGMIARRKSALEGKK